MSSTVLSDANIVTEAAEKGELRVQQCDNCSRWVWFPRVACPYCFERALVWKKAKGGGTVLATTIVHKTHHRDYEPHVPIALVMIQLDEGCEMVASVVGETRTSVQIGDRLHVTADGRWSRLPQFSLVDASS